MNCQEQAFLMILKNRKKQISSNNQVKFLIFLGLISGIKPAMTFDEVVSNHIKFDHIKNFNKNKNNCDDLKKIVERLEKLKK